MLASASICSEPRFCSIPQVVIYRRRTSCRATADGLGTGAFVQVAWMLVAWLRVDALLQQGWRWLGLH